jgi:glycosyltransferase involved in cell wall biosynthesis
MKIILSMPCFNEADGIEEFIDEIEINLGSLLNRIVIVNDFSTDSTSKVLNMLQVRNSKISVLNNASNLGHGPSFVNAIKHTLSFTPDIVITVDGDGQFDSREMLAKLKEFMESDTEILECARVSRKDPLFRKFVTYSLRILIFCRTKKMPQDANTPLRIYRADILQNLISQIPHDSLVPNLRFSALSRKGKFKLVERNVHSLVRRGNSPTGSTWKAKNVHVPSKRFIKFCTRAIREVWVNPI